MITLYEKVMFLYPDLKIEDFLSTIELKNDGDERGDYIAKWEHPTHSKPTDEQLASIGNN